jgi:RHS repeat-associated protein
VWGSVLSQSYDAVGNITAKSDVGTYGYPLPGTARPHAVTGITAIPGQGQPNLSYGYDAGGNMTAWTGLDNSDRVAPTSLTYSNGNMVGSIGQGTGYVLNFAYTAEQQRARMTTGTATTVAQTTYYMGFDSLTHSELRISGSNPKTAPPTWIDYLEIAGETVGQVTTSCTAAPCTAPNSGTAGNSTTAATFFSTDHLGSVTALQTSGTANTKQSYDEWGRRRAFGSAGAPPSGNIASPEHRGYIGQEELDQVGLINLNRRLYDARIGRFLAADPIARGFFGDPQGLNRYAYVKNLPLSASDRTGRQGLLGAGIGAALGGIGGYIATDGSTKGTLVGMLAGGTAGLVSVGLSEEAATAALALGGSQTTVAAAGMFGFSAGGALTGVTGQIGTNIVTSKPAFADTLNAGIIGALAPGLSGESLFAGTAGRTLPNISKLANDALGANSGLLGLLGIIGTSDSSPPSSTGRAHLPQQQSDPLRFSDWDHVPALMPSLPSLGDMIGPAAPVGLPNVSIPGMQIDNQGIAAAITAGVNHDSSSDQTTPTTNTSQ